MLWIVEHSTISGEGLRLYRRIGAVNPPPGQSMTFDLEAIGL
jgi:hypothetical protein